MKQEERKEANTNKRGDGQLAIKMYASRKSQQRGTLLAWGSHDDRRNLLCPSRLLLLMLRLLRGRSHCAHVDAAPANSDPDSKRSARHQRQHGDRGRQKRASLRTNRAEMMSACDSRGSICSLWKNELTNHFAQWG